MFVVTVVAAVTSFPPWLPLLVAAVEAAVAGSALFVLELRAAREQQRARQVESARLDRWTIGYRDGLVASSATSTTASSGMSGE